MEEAIRQNFTLSGYKNFCNIRDCKTGKKGINGNRLFSLRRHLEQCHPSVIEKIVSETYSPKFDEKNYALQKEQLLQHLIEIVTVNGRPINSLFDSGFQKAIEHQIRQLAQHGHEVKLYYGMIIKRIESLSIEVQKEIEMELKGQTVNLLIDIATRHSRSILGVNLQYVVNGEIKLRTIGVIPLNCRHTSENITKVIIDLLKKFGVELNQVFDFTSDNGSNMIATRNRLNMAALDEETEWEEEDDEQNAHQQDPTMAILLDNDYFNDLVKAIGDDFAKQGVKEAIYDFRCGNSQPCIKNI